MDVAIINTVIIEMPYKVLLTINNNASVPGDDARRVTSRIKKQEDFIYI